MRNRAALTGLVLSVVVLLVAASGFAQAKPDSSKGHNGKGHAYGHTKGTDQGTTGVDQASEADGTDGNVARGGGNGSSADSADKNGKAGKAGTTSEGDETHPPGNNGTVKVDGAPWDSAPDNEPHPGCTFEIDFYGYDEGDLNATYTFDLHPPSGTGTISSGSLFIGEDAAGGGTDLDASTGPLDLSQAIVDAGGVANKNQGYHVKLTVHAEGSIGSDVKHKVFWIDDCSEETSTTSTGSSGSGEARPGRPGTGSAPARPSGAASGHAAAARPARAVRGTPAFTG